MWELPTLVFLIMCLQNIMVEIFYWELKIRIELDFLKIRNNKFLMRWSGLGLIMMKVQMLAGIEVLTDNQKDLKYIKNMLKNWWKKAKRITVSVRQIDCKNWEKDKWRWNKHLDMMVIVETCRKKKLKQNWQLVSLMLLDLKCLMKGKLL